MTCELKLLLLNGSGVLLQLGSLLMSMAHVTTKGHIDAWDLGLSQSPLPMLVSKGHVTTGAIPICVS